jgi:phosphoribosylanthranilate isomerase
MLIKICGTTTSHDVLLAARAGADYLGIIVEHLPSPRNVDLESAIEIRDALQRAGLSTPLVAVTVNLPIARLLEIQELLAPQVLQLHGDESPELVAQLVERGARVWATAGEGEAALQRASTLLGAGAEAILVDARAQTSSGTTIYGGTGKSSDWSLARELSQSGARVVLSGGLNPQNVAHAIEQVQPWIVDAVSGVEARPGVKDENKVRTFIEAARATCRE